MVLIVRYLTLWYVMLLYGTLWYFIVPINSLWQIFVFYDSFWSFFSTWTNMFQNLQLQMTKLAKKHHSFHKIEIFYRIWSANNSV